MEQHVDLALRKPAECFCGAVVYACRVHVPAKEADCLGPADAFVGARCCLGCLEQTASVKQGDCCVGVLRRTVRQFGGCLIDRSAAIQQWNQPWQQRLHGCASKHLQFARSIDQQIVQSPDLRQVCNELWSSRQPELRVEQHCMGHRCGVHFSSACH